MDPHNVYLHLDVLGGIAGDMFAAAIIDLRPEFGGELREAFEAAGLARYVAVRDVAHHDHGLSGRRFEVEERDPAHAAAHRSWREIREFIEGRRLASAVRDRALAIFQRLAEAEGRVHGVPVEEVSFHEVGAWDSIADIVAAAWLIERLDAVGWSCGPLPLGSGRIHTAHGQLPVPAPATALLLEGFPVIQDGVAGERITPTGAAILRHLEPDFDAGGPVRRLTGSGTGFGTRRLEGISNTLRVLAFEGDAVGYTHENISVCRFEVDDQTPEDLAVALEHLRAVEGVIDISQAPALGKKGRVAAHIQILARPENLEQVLAACLNQTSTLGVRWTGERRVVLARTEARVSAAGRELRVKRATRPDGTITRKAEMADLADEPGGLAARQRLRHEAEE